jgi:hypothetical protein
MSLISINDLTCDLLDLISRMIDPTLVKTLRATCSISDMGKMAPLVMFQDSRYKAAKKIQIFWNNKRVPNENDEYWSRVPWSLLSDNHPIHNQYKRLLIVHYPLEHLHSMTRQLVRLRGLELDEEKCGTVLYWASLVSTSSNDQLADLGW